MKNKKAKKQKVSKGSKRSNLIKFSAVLVGSLIVLVIGYSLSAGETTSHQLCTRQVSTIDNSCEYSLETVDTDESRALGLSGRESLAESEGMLFVFDEPEDNCIWMKGMKFNLDIIWLNDQKEIIALENDVSPNTFPKTFCPNGSSKYVIELNGGEIIKSNYELKDKFNF